MVQPRERWRRRESNQLGRGSTAPFAHRIAGLTLFAPLRQPASPRGQPVVGTTTVHNVDGAAGTTDATRPAAAPELTVARLGSPRPVVSPPRPGATGDSHRGHGGGGVNPIATVSNCELGERRHMPDELPPVCCGCCRTSWALLGRCSTVLLPSRRTLISSLLVGVPAAPRREPERTAPASDYHSHQPHRMPVLVPLRSGPRGLRHARAAPRVATWPGPSGNVRRSLCTEHLDHPCQFHGTTLSPTEAPTREPPGTTRYKRPRVWMFPIRCPPEPDADSTTRHDPPSRPGHASNNGRPLRG